MAEGLILETSFLIDLERERHQQERGPAHTFLDSHSRTSLHLTVTVLGELAAGLAPTERPVLDRLSRWFRILPIDAEACWRYGQAYRYLQVNGLLIGANDLWIAATALAAELPLVTSDVEHFRRVPGLEVVGYR